MVGWARGPIVAAWGSLIGILSLACAQEGVYRLDPEYSEFLTIMAGTYRVMESAEVADTVDLLRIYRVQQQHFDMYSLRQLASKSLVFQSEDKAEIRQLIRAVAERVEIPDCARERSFPLLHVVAFDREQSRVGYFTVVPCVASDQAYGQISNLRTSGVYYNQEFLAKLGPRIWTDESLRVPEGEHGD